MTDSKNQWLQVTIAHLYQHAPGFRRRMDAAGLVSADIQTTADLRKLPVLHKDDLINLQQADPPFAGMLSVPTGELRRIYQSPGPINDPEPAVDDYWRWEEALRAAGFQAGDVVLVALSYHMTPAANMAEEALRKIGAAVIPGGIGNQAQQIGLMQSVGANGYFGLPSYLKALFDKAAASDSPLAVEHAFVFAEPLPPSLRSELEAHGTTVFQGYGTAECGNLGYELADYEGWRIPDSAIIEICDINSGQPLPAGDVGEVVVSVLDDHYALIRFGVGDLSAIIPESLTDGGGPRLTGWLGRVGAATKVRGMFLHPSRLRNLLADMPEVVAYQAVITREDHRDKLTLALVISAESDQTALATQLQTDAREQLKIRVDALDFVGSLPTDAPLIRDERVWE